MDKINYFLYHIPGKKIGVTRDLISRVVDQQGYSLDEVEVLDQSTDINYISDRELELQQSYGYRVDRQKYKELYINKINSVVRKKEELAKERIDNEIETFISIMFFFIILSIIVSLFFSKAIHRIFNDYKLKVDKKEQELKKLNELLEIKVKEKTKELKKLNESLEIRVKEEVKKSNQKDKDMFQQARLAQMGEMIGNIAHQWKQPLNELGLILSSFEIATLQNRLNDEFIKDRMQKGENVIQKMSHMIDDFRNFSILHEDHTITKEDPPPVIPL